jgi:hypothetical protein
MTHKTRKPAALRSRAVSATPKGQPIVDTVKGYRIGAFPADNDQGIKALLNNGTLGHLDTALTTILDFLRDGGIVAQVAKELEADLLRTKGILDLLYTMAEAGVTDPLDLDHNDMGDS